ncbi:hypothetical protein HDU96_008186 [Phlyctochytrium bullatum]|nr:hypothetical protein HDU96_008186 [Phlyctochytrium bullatum]
MLPSVLFAAAVLSGVASAAPTDLPGPGTTGNCLSGVYTFDKNRIYNVPAGSMPAIYPPVLSNVDWSAYDFTIDYAPDHVSLNTTGNGGLAISVTKAGFQGARLSTTRYNLYGKFTMRIKGVGTKGIVTTFITMSDRGDEIDWELVNANPSQPATTNVFFKRILEFGVRDKALGYPSGKIDDWHEYTIDWNSQRIQWSIDGQVLREYARKDSWSDKDNDYYYPSTPSVIQFGAWDGGDSSSQGTSQWAGGPVNWGDNDQFTAEYGPLTMQCYDDKDAPVDMWPIQGNRGRSTATTTLPSTTSSVAPATSVSTSTTSISIITVPTQTIKPYVPTSGSSQAPASTSATVLPVTTATIPFVSGAGRSFVSAASGLAAVAVAALVFA